MIKRNPTPFYVINFNVNNNFFEKYDVMPYLIECYKSTKKKDRPTTLDEFKEFVKTKSMYMYWSRCQYEIVLVDWPCRRADKKIDVYWQIMNNFDLVVRLVMENVGVK